MKTNLLKTTMVLALAFVLPLLSNAQELPPGGPINVNTAIDSWILIFIGTGALYGIFKMWNSNNHPMK